MNAALQTAIATHLNISPNQIKSVEEWSSVLFVRFTVGRPRFVSKKVTTMSNPVEKYQAAIAELDSLPLPCDMTDEQADRMMELFDIKDEAWREIPESHELKIHAAKVRQYLENGIAADCLSDELARS